MAKLTSYATVVTLNEGALLFTAIDTDGDSLFESRKVSIGSLRAHLLNSQVSDGASAVAFSYNTVATLSTSGALLAAWKNNGTVKFSIDKDGSVSIDSGYFLSGVADGSTAEAFVFDTAALTTAGAKAFVVKNNGTEIFSIDKDGNATLGKITFSAEDGITAYAGGGQANAHVLDNMINEVSVVATAGDSVKLPVGEAGLRRVVINNSANSCDVFPATGEDLGAGINTAQPLAGGNTIEYACYKALNWRQL